MRRVAAAALVLAAAACLGGTAPASAAPATGTCPGPFLLLDRAQQIALATRLRPAYTPEEVVAAVDEGLARFDKNGDGQLCVQVKQRPVEAPNVNLIDNKVQGQ